MPKHELIDMAGKTFGQLTVLDRAGRTAAGKARWRCECSCGKVVVVPGANLRGGKYKSCGCAKSARLRELRTSHGASGSAEYLAYHNMLARCAGKRKADRQGYFERGIQVCNRWLNGENGMAGFQCFLLDMGAKPSASMSLDRIDNDGDYTPDNCRWASPSQQMKNRRPSALSGLRRHWNRGRQGVFA